MVEEIFHHEKSGIGGFIGMLVATIIFLYVLPIFMISMLASSKQPLAATQWSVFDSNFIFGLWQINSISYFGLEAGLIFIILNVVILIPLLLVFPRKSHTIFETDSQYLIKRKSKGVLSSFKSYKIEDIDYISSKSLTTITTSTGKDSGYGTRVSTAHSLSIVMKGRSFKEEKLLTDKNPTLIQKLAESLRDSLGVKIK